MGGGREGFGGEGRLSAGSVGQAAERVPDFQHVVGAAHGAEPARINRGQRAANKLPAVESRTSTPVPSTKVSDEKATSFLRPSVTVLAPHSMSA